MPDLNLGHTRAIIAEARSAGLTLQQTAYVLATAYWETARSMQPVREAYYLGEPKAEKHRKTLRYYPWYGRGFVQLTWRENYAKASKKIGLDLLADPDRAMIPAAAAQILVLGSKEGWFTGKKLADYINAKGTDYVGARRIINGTDKASEIAAIARQYEAALIAEQPKNPPAVPEQTVAQNITATAIVVALIIAAIAILS